MGPIKYLNSIANRGIQPGLERSRALMQLLDHPENRFKSIHVAGTNGKGSVCAMLESILRKSGYRTGLYTSPHLIDVRERIQVNGNIISSQSFQYWINTIRTRARAIEPTLTYFEILTAVAFAYFAEHKVQCAIVEVGLGGRLDSTNVLPKPEISIITNISIEHTQYLGKNVRSIAKEKGGIIKQNGVCLTSAEGASLPIFRSICKEKKARYILVNQISPMAKYLALNKKSNCGLKGYFQTRNIQVVLKAVEILREVGWKIPQNKVLQGFKCVKWPGRFEQSNLKFYKRYCPLLIDGAHNPHAIEKLLDSIKKTSQYKKKCLMIFNFLKDKNGSEMLNFLINRLNIYKVFVPMLKSSRSSNPEFIKKLFLSHSKKIEVVLFDSVKGAWKKLKELKTDSSFDWVLVTGSLILIGETRSLLHNEKR